MSIQNLSDQELLSLIGNQQESAAPQGIQSLSDEELMKLIGDQTAPTQSNLPQESFQQANRRRVGQFAEGIKQGLGNVAIGGVQAATDVGEKAAQLIEKLYFGDNLQMNTFGNRLAEQVRQRKAEQAQLPTAERAGIFVGETAPFITGGATTGAKVAAATGSKIAGLAAGSVVSGGEMSFLSPREQAGLENRAIETVKDAGTGAAFGVGLGVGAKVVGGVAKGVKGLFTAKTAEDVLAARLPKEQTAQLLEQLKTATPDNPVLLPDIAGDSVKGLTRSVAKLPVARDIVTDTLENRSKAAVSRVSDYLAKDISPVDNYFGNLADLSKARSEVSKPLYDKVKGATLPTKGNEELLSKIAPELKTVRNDFRLSPEEAPDNSFTLLHHVKESLYDKAQVLKRQGANAQARVYDNLRTELTKKMGEVSPDYKKANEVFGGFSQLQGAQEKGLGFSKLRPEEIRREMLGMNAGERDAYRIGVREDLQKVVSSTADGADPAKRIFGNEFKREQLRAVFGNETKFKEFEEKLATEIRAADTKAKVLGGSRSDYNMAGDDEFLNKVVQGGFTVAKSKVNPLYLAEATYNAISNKFAGINKRNAEEIARSLVDRGQTIKTLENIIQREKNPIQKRIALEAKDFITSNLLIKSSMGGNNEAQAQDFQGMSEEQIRQQLMQRQEKEPILMQGIDVNSEAKKIKNRYSR